jgi:hypothetical protein
MRLCLFCCLVLLALPAHALEIAGVPVVETVETEDGAVLHLNGAGIRKKFLFDIYLAQLYLPQPLSAAAEVIASDGRKRVVMHFLHSEVGRDKLVAAWEEGFADNTAAAELAQLREKIDTFNGLFVDVKKDELIVLDYLPGTGTVVTVAGAVKGTIAGKEFNDALLRIWLGEKPINKELKKQLLGGI